MYKDVWGGELLCILIAENMELNGGTWYTVYVVENDYQEFDGGKTNGHRKTV